MKIPPILFIAIPLAFCSGQTPRVSENVQLEGISTYYEVYGSGEPLFLLHGWSQSSASWKPFVSDFANTYSVYVIDLHGHGKSSPLEEPLDVGVATSNFLNLVEYLRIEKAKAIGFSFGGRVLLQTAIEKPDLLKSLIVIGSSNLTFAELSLPELTPEWHAHLLKVHAHGDEQIDALFKRPVGTLQTKEMLANVLTNTLIVVGEHDEFVDLDTSFNLHKMLPNSHLWVVPNKSHFAHTDDSKPEFVRIASEFLGDEWNN